LLRHPGIDQLIDAPRAIARERALDYWFACGLHGEAHQQRASDAPRPRR